MHANQLPYTVKLVGLLMQQLKDHSYLPQQPSSLRNCRSSVRFSLLLQGLLEMSKKYPIIDIRGRGLMVAVEFGEHRGVDGSYTAKAGCAAAVTKAAQKRNMILLTAGDCSRSMFNICSNSAQKSDMFFLMLLSVWWAYIHISHLNGCNC